MRTNLARTVIIAPPKDTLQRALITKVNDLVDQSNAGIALGAVLPSVPNLTLTSAIHHISGTAAIQNIFVPPKFLSGVVHLIPDGLWTTVTGGNIILGSTAVVNKALIMTWDGGFWYPSYT